MKILVLSPVDEQHAISSTRLINGISKKDIDRIFPMAGYADFLIKTKKANNWEDAVIKSFITLQTILKDNPANIVIIGNAPKNFLFDDIVTYDSGEEQKYQDNFLTYIQKNNQDPKLTPYINNLYSAEDSHIKLMNEEATKKLLVKLLNIEQRSREEYDRIYAEYEQWKQRNFLR